MSLLLLKRKILAWTRFEPGSGENFSLKLTTQDLSEGYSENLNIRKMDSIQTRNMRFTHYNSLYKFPLSFPQKPLFTSGTLHGIMDNRRASRSVIYQAVLHYCCSVHNAQKSLNISHFHISFSYQ